MGLGFLGSACRALRGGADLRKIVHPADKKTRKALGLEAPEIHDGSPVSLARQNPKEIQKGKPWICMNPPPPPPVLSSPIPNL